MKKAILFSLFSSSIFTSIHAQNHEVQIAGAMHNVMRKGDLSNTIHLDTLSHKKNLYGLGPKENLKGELLVINGASYISSIGENNQIIMQKSFDVKAPFFVYTNNTDWQEKKLPKWVKSSVDLEKYLEEFSKNQEYPFVFKLTGTFKKVGFHIQNLPDGTIIKSPKDAHTNQRKFVRENVAGDIVGFFSKKHQTIFTHHDSFIHIHYINNERTEMGHIDDLIIDNKVKLYLPKNIN